MARPSKTGVDYFPLDINDDDKIELLEAKHGLEGYAILVKLWKKIYKDSYYTNWNEDIEMLFARKINSDINLVNSVVNECLRRSLFNKGLFEKHGILTSNGIQQRYFKICSDCKRKNVKTNSEYLLLDIKEFGFTTIKELTPELTIVKDGVNPELTIVKEVESTQRREEKIKEEKRREDKSKKDNNKNCFSVYHDTFKKTSKQDTEEIGTFLDDGIEDGLIIKVLEKYKDKSWGYVRGTLSNLLKDGIKTLKAFELKSKSKCKKESNKEIQDKTKQNLEDFING